jgi:integrase
MTTHDNLEPMDPREAFELFLDHKATECAKATVRNYKYRMQYFVQWCEEEGIDNLNELSGRDIQRYRLWRQEEMTELNTLTLRNHLCSLRVFLQWCGSIEAVEPNLYDKIVIPKVGHGERKRDAILRTDTAKEILEYLSRYHFASVEHMALSVFWETGLRIGAAISINRCDIDFDDESIHLRHRPREGTPLKNGLSGERPVAITPELAELLQEHIENCRHDVVDEHGREPLFTTREGRMHKNTLRKMIYRITAPCFRDEDCPDCERETSKVCPEAVSPHAIRRGSITHFLTEGVPVEIVSDRMNVSRDVLDEHYDERTEEVKLEQRRGYLDTI